MAEALDDGETIGELAQLVGDAVDRLIDDTGVENAVGKFDGMHVATLGLGTWFLGKPEYAFAKDVAHHVRGSTHDRVRGGVGESLSDVVP